MHLWACCGYDDGSHGNVPDGLAWEQLLEQAQVQTELVDAYLGLEQHGLAG